MSQIQNDMPQIESPPFYLFIYFLHSSISKSSKRLLGFGMGRNTQDFMILLRLGVRWKESEAKEWGSPPINKQTHTRFGSAEEGPLPTRGEEEQRPQDPWH